MRPWLDLGRTDWEIPRAPSAFLAAHLFLAAARQDGSIELGFVSSALPKYFVTTNPSWKEKKKTRNSWWRHRSHWTRWDWGIEKKEEAIIRMTPIRYWDCGADTQTERKETKAALTRSGRYKYKNVDEESRGKERTRSGDDILKWIRDKRARTDGLDAAWEGGTGWGREWWFLMAR